MQQNKTVDCFNAAFAADPNAIRALMINRVPCNQSLADDPFVQVAAPETIESGFEVGALGLINAALAANGLPLLAMRLSEPVDGRCKMLGFCEYVPPIQ